MHDAGGIIDIVCSTFPSTVVDVTDFGLVDRRLLKRTIDLRRPPSTYVTSKRRQWRNFDDVGFGRDSPLMTSLSCTTSQSRICLTIKCRFAVLPCDSIRRPSGLTTIVAWLNGGCAVLSRPFVVSVACPIPLCQLLFIVGMSVVATLIFCTGSDSC
jgi:hypothetical protein